MKLSYQHKTSGGLDQTCLHPSKSEMDEMRSLGRIFKEHDFVLSLIRKCILKKSFGAHQREKERRFITTFMGISNLKIHLR